MALKLDDIMPRYQFSEFHTIQVAAPPATVYRALKSITSEEIRCFRTLTWLRRLGRTGPESILNMPRNQPVMDVALRSGFERLAEAEGSELVIGTRLMNGATLAAMNFRIVPSEGGSRVSIETRILTSNEDARRRFARYWRIIHPGSALIRRSWLRAIRRRAERQYVT
jgi:hypothetical protein